jgi:hypothetical protein
VLIGWLMNELQDERYNNENTRNLNFALHSHENTMSAGCQDDSTPDSNETNFFAEQNAERKLNGNEPKLLEETLPCGAQNLQQILKLPM